MKLEELKEKFKRACEIMNGRPRYYHDLEIVTCYGVTPTLNYDIKNKRIYTEEEIRGFPLDVHNVKDIFVTGNGMEIRTTNGIVVWIRNDNNLSFGFSNSKLKID